MSYAPVEPGAVLLLHGVGLAPRLFETLSNMVSAPAIAPLRSPYEPAEHAAGHAVGSVESQAAELAAAIAGSRDVTVVGVSGGATIALALALLGPPGVVGVVAHEPLVGRLAPDLHAAVSASAATLAGTTGPDGVLEFLARLVGDVAWAALPAHAADFARQHADVVRHEVPRFAAYRPDPATLAALRVPTVVSTGSLSHPRRHLAARALAGVAPVAATTVEGAGHLAHVDQPGAFAVLVERHRREWTQP